MENTCLEDPRDVRPACQGIAPISVVQFCPVGHTTRDVPGSAPLPHEHLKIQIFYITFFLESMNVMAIQVVEFSNGGIKN